MDNVLFIRLAERCFITGAFVFIVCFLIYLYRNDVSKDKTEVKSEKLHITLAVTIPVTIMLVFLGYVFISLSHPIEWKETQTNSDKIKEARAFDSDNLLEINTSLLSKLHSEREIGPEDLMRFQGVISLSIKTNKLLNGKNWNKINESLHDNQVNYKKFEEIVEDLSKKE